MENGKVLDCFSFEPVANIDEVHVPRQIAK